MPSLIITACTSTRDKRGFSLNCSIVSPESTDTLWFRIETTAADAEPPVTLDWALVALLLPAMRRGWDIRVDGSLSAHLLFNVNHDVQTALCLFDPELRRIAVSAAAVSTSRSAQTRRRGTGFSAGIDSFATLSSYASDTPLPVTDLCVFNVGAFGRFDDPAVEWRFAEGYARARTVAREIGCGAFGIDSNIDQFFERRAAFQRTHVLRNIAAALTIEQTFDGYLYSSSFPFGDIKVAPHYDMSIIDPIMLPLLSTENIAFVSAGAGLSRFEKTAIVARNPLSHAELDVCVAPAELRRSLPRQNCSHCWKCSRTMLSLDALGALDDYHAVFDVPYFRREQAAIRTLVAVRAYSGSAIDRELIDKLRLSRWQRVMLMIEASREIFRRRVRAMLGSAKKSAKNLLKAGRKRTATTPSDG